MARTKGGTPSAGGGAGGGARNVSVPLAMWDFAYSCEWQRFYRQDEWQRRRPVTPAPAAAGVAGGGGGGGGGSGDGSIGALLASWLGQQQQRLLQSGDNDADMFWADVQPGYLVVSVTVFETRPNTKCRVIRSFF